MNTLKVKKTDAGLVVEINLLASRGSMVGVTGSGCVHVFGGSCHWSRCGTANLDNVGLVTSSMDLSVYHFCSRCLIELREDAVAP